MRWADLMVLAENTVVENISDTSSDFFQKYPLKAYAASVQSYASRMIPCMDGDTTLTTVATQEMYSLPADYFKMVACRYNKQLYMTEVWRRPDNVTDVKSTPTSYYVKNNQIGFYPIPFASAQTIYLWYYKQIAPYACRIQGTTKTISVTIDPTNLSILYYTTAPATTTKTYALATYTTVATLMAAVNADTATTGALMTACPTFVTTGLSSNLEQISAITITSKSIMLFNEPELPEEMQFPILTAAMNYRLKMMDREVGLADRYKIAMDDAIKDFYVKFKERKEGAKNLDFNDGGYQIRGLQLAGGTLIIT